MELMHGGSDFDNEVKRVMAKMPHWKPGKQNGQNIAVYYRLPVIFQSSGDN
jgi:protein TonB